MVRQLINSKVESFQGLTDAQDRNSFESTHFRFKKNGFSLRAGQHTKITNTTLLVTRCDGKIGALTSSVAGGSNSHLNSVRRFPNDVKRLGHAHAYLILDPAWLRICQRGRLFWMGWRWQGIVRAGRSDG